MDNYQRKKKLQKQESCFPVKKGRMSHFLFLGRKKGGSGEKTKHFRDYLNYSTDLDEKVSPPKKIDEMNFLEREEKKGESLSTENDFFKNYKKLVTATKIFLTRHNSVVHY